ncbi:hypothetical protein AGOR_G00189970 [Albula goreensis]|uniref:Transforming acidic coiled-coil-containing protein C-terminal domain-containing protein n=1 Tax=Albula goreensis TaxID=1534307 RepID=A0A8T3CST0_9TELE|nr:hypothetical protein AGOR_G00189970 [Albula goreensis]
MSALTINDENLGESCSGKQSGSDVTCNIFSTAQPTGRPSILRQSQMENLPSKSVPKGVKVCFQTPRRDPVTKRILSPSNAKMSGLVESEHPLKTLSKETASLETRGTTVIDQPKADVSDISKAEEPCLDEDVIIPSKVKTQTSIQSESFTASTEMPEKVVEPATTLDETLPYSSFTEHSLDVSTVVIERKQEEEAQNEAVAVDEKEVLDLKANSSLNQGEQLVNASPVIPKGSYNFDFDNLDFVNPFKTGGSKIQNSPEISKPLSSCATRATPEPLPNVDSSQESVLPDIKTTALRQGDPKPKASRSFNKSGMGAKMNAKKPDGQTGKMQVENSRQEETTPQMGLDDTPAQKHEPVQTGPRVGVVAPVSVVSVTPSMTAKQDKTLTEDGNTTVSSAVQECLLISDRNKLQTPEPPTKLGPAEHSLCSLAAADEEFVPGSTFMSADFGQIDYLEQFGSSTFKESALRKQSLYLKFDPLLKDSPKKPPACATELPQIPLPPLFTSRLERQSADAGAKEQCRADKINGLGFLEDFPAPAAGPLVPNPNDTLITPFSEPIGGEGAIIEVLKYSQSDMDAVIARVQAEAQERNDELQTKYDKLWLANQEMGKIMADFEATVSQVMADSQKQKAESQKELQKVMQEKEQVVMDLNAMERSFAELFKRLEKHKEVIEGYRKNEDILKKCAQDYLARIKKEEQRYQTLKAHAEEKIGQANEEIAQVRSKLKAETSALQAQLRREQLKVQSLEKSLEQKVKETEELTKLCDDLIVNVQKR